MPAAADGSRKPRGTERFERAWIVVGAGEDQIAARAGQTRRLLEKAGIVAFDAAQPLEQGVLERGRIDVAQEGGDRGHARFVGRHAVGLAVVDHLQAMLDPAQEAIGLDQFLGRH